MTTLASDCAGSCANYLLTRFRQLRSNCPILKRDVGLCLKEITGLIATAREYVGGSTTVRCLLQLLRDGVLVPKEHLVAEVFPLLHTNEIVQRVKTQSSFALLEKDEDFKTRKIELVSDPLTGSSGIVKVPPASFMELFEIVDFAFYFDRQIDIGGAFR